MPPQILAHAHHVFDAALRAELLALNSPGPDELDRSARCANELARRYAAAVRAVLTEAAVSPKAVRAVGCHGQTVRHRPDRGYTVQLGNPALLAELCGARVVADFRSRDIAAGGQGAPLAPAFHAALLRSRGSTALCSMWRHRNLTWLASTGDVAGFDCGPGNC